MRHHNRPPTATEPDDMLPPVMPVHSAGLSRAQWWRRAMLAALASVIVAVLVAAGTRMGTSPTPRDISPPALIPLTPPPYPTAAPPTATPLPLLPPLVAAAGWAASSTPSFAHAVAFAPSDPARAYACGAPPATSALAPPGIIVALSVNAGGVWAQRPTPASGKYCALSVDPLNPQDVALLVNTCNACLPRPANTLWRSRDGGQTWAQTVLPAGNPNSDPTQFGDTLAWAGANLFATPGANLVPTHPLAVSRNGGAFQWVNETSLFAGIADPQQSVSLLTPVGVGATLYITLTFTTAKPQVTIARSSDGGQTWTRSLSSLAPTFSVPIALTGGGTDGRTLVGTPYLSSDSNTYRSLDGGRTWAAFPRLGDGTVLSLLTQAPDGIWYGLATNTARPGIYRLASAAAWTYLAPPPYVAEVTPLIAAQPDATGRAIRLWASAWPDSSGQLGAGPLVTHAP